MSEMVSLLDRPVYALPQIDNILRLSPGTARRWIDGYDRQGRHYEPLIRPETTGDEIATWGEYVETRLLAEFRSEGAKILQLRPAIALLRQRTETNYPLAHHQTLLSLHGKELVLEIQDELELPEAIHLVIRTDQLVLAPAVAEFEAAANYDKSSNTVDWLRPVTSIHEVHTDPLLSSGDPVVRGVRTEVLGELNRTGDTVEELADLYQLTESQVRDALQYESYRRRDVA